MIEKNEIIPNDKDKHTPSDGDEFILKDTVVSETNNKGNFNNGVLLISKRIEKLKEDGELKEVFNAWNDFQRLENNELKITAKIDTGLDQKENVIILGYATFKPDEGWSLNF